MLMVPAMTQNTDSHNRYKYFRTFRRHLPLNEKRLESGCAAAGAAAVQVHRASDDRVSESQQDSSRNNSARSVVSSELGHVHDGGKILEPRHHDAWSKVPSVYRVDLLPDRFLTAASETVGLHRHYHTGLGMRVSSAAASLASASEKVLSRVSSAVEPLSRTPSWSRTPSSIQSPGHRRLSIGMLPSTPVPSDRTAGSRALRDSLESGMVMPIGSEVPATEEPAPLLLVELPGASGSAKFSPRSPKAQPFRPVSRPLVGHWYGRCENKTWEQNCGSNRVEADYDHDGCEPFSSATGPITDGNAGSSCAANGNGIYRTSDF